MSDFRNARYKPYGSYRGTPPTATALDRGYTGHDRTTADDGLGLVYMNARYLDSSTGRFISADTLVPEPGNPQAFNRYSYALGNPVMLVDPSGHFSEEAIWKYLWDVCGGVHGCAHRMYDQWRADGEWWGMLRAAQAGDVIFASATDRQLGIYFHFQGTGQDMLTGVAYSMSEHSIQSTYGDTAYGRSRLHDIFSGRNTVTWGGLFRKDSRGRIVDVLLRMSVTRRYRYAGDASNLTSDAIESVATEAVSEGLCSLVSRGIGGAAACGAVVSGSIGAAGEITNPFRNGVNGPGFLISKRDLSVDDEVWVVAGHVFAFHSASDFGHSPPRAIRTDIYYYGVATYWPRWVLTTHWRYTAE